MTWIEIVYNKIGHTRSVLRQVRCRKTLNNEYSMNSPMVKISLIAKYMEIK